MSTDQDTAGFGVEAAQQEVRAITHRLGLAAATAVALLATAVISFAAPI